MASCCCHGYFCLKEAMLHNHLDIPKNSSLTSKTLEILRESTINAINSLQNILHLQFLKTSRWALTLGLSDTNLKSRDSCYHLKQAPQREIITVYPKKMQDKKIIKDTFVVKICQNAFWSICQNLLLSASPELFVFHRRMDGPLL